MASSLAFARSLVIAHTLAWLALTATLGACASGRPNVVADGYAGAPGVRNVLLCPMNLVVALPRELRKGVRPVELELLQYLERRGQAVANLDRVAGRKLWTQSVAEARSADALTRAPEIFVGELAKDHTFDVVVVPSLILLQTRIDANYGAWDGVHREMRMTEDPVVGISREDARFAKSNSPDGRVGGRPFNGVSGQAWVTSLHVLVYARDGSRVFEGRGGIDFMQEIDFIEPGRSFRYRLRPNGAIFLDRSVLVDGITQAFTPYLAPPDA